MNTNNHSANEFRQMVRREQQAVIKELCFSKITKIIYEKGDLQTISEAVLGFLKEILNIEHSLVALSENAFLSIIAATGKTYPTGSRIPKIASLADIFKSSAVFDVYTIQRKQLFTLTNADDELAFAVPLYFNGQAIGILAYSILKPVPKEQYSFLQIMASLLTLSMQKSSLKSNKVDTKILEQITPREREVLALIPKGYTNSEIAEKLGIATGTVKIHIEHILSKLGLKDRTQAAVKATELGL